MLCPMPWPGTIGRPDFPHCCIQPNPKQHSVTDNITPLKSAIRTMLIRVWQTEIDDQIPPKYPGSYLQF